MNLKGAILALGATTTIGCAPEPWLKMHEKPTAVRDYGNAIDNNLRVEILAAHIANKFVDGYFPYINLTDSQLEAVGKVFHHPVKLNQFLVNLFEQVSILSGGKQKLRMTTDKERDECGMRVRGPGIYLTLVNADHPGRPVQMMFGPYPNPFQPICSEDEIQVERQEWLD